MHTNKRTVHVTWYQHIDYWHSITDPQELADLVRQERLPCTEENAKRAFIAAGWEGDGFIEAFWIPPFMLPNPDTTGIHIWHVKQSNNGTSWLCAEQPYEFPALANSPG